MPVLRLFAAAREAAGTASVEVPGATVDEVLSAARARFGPEFATVVGASRVWRNGEPASGPDAVAPADEVAVLPPVSGGSGDGARPRFRPAEPPEPARRPPVRRSPGAEQVAERRAAGAERRTTGGASTGPAARRQAPGPDGGPRRPPGAEGPERRATGGPSGPAPSRRPRPSGTGVRVRGDKTPRPKPVDARADRPERPRPTPPPPIEPGVLTRVPTVTGAPIEPRDDAPATAEKANVLTRMRSVGVPVTGAVTVRGKERRVSGARERRTTIGQRYAVVYDTDGPKVTLGVAWFVAVVVGIVVGWWVLTFVFAIAAGWAAMEASLRWRERGVAADPLVAGLGAAVVAGAGAAGARYVGGAILLVVAAAVAHVALTPIGRHHTLSAAGNTVGCAIPFGLAAAAVILTNDLEIGAVVVLVLFVSGYEVADFLVGSGASNSIEGPVSGVVTIAVLALPVALLESPPFEGAAVFPFAAFAAVACVLGQLAASAILPAADAHAPSVRRLDSYLLLAPAWVWAVGVFTHAS